MLKLLHQSQLIVIFSIFRVEKRHAIQSKGLENVTLVAQTRKSWILNDIIALNLFYTGELELSDETFRRISDCLNAINVTGFEEYAADR